MRVTVIQIVVGPMQVTVLYCSLSHAFPDSLFITSLFSLVVFERSTAGQWHSLPRTSTNGYSGLLEQFANLLANQRKEKLSLNN